MTHLPFIAAAYAIFAAATLYMVADAAIRLRGATRKLRALDPRKPAA
jgi:hypothetical protein